MLRLHVPHQILERSPAARAHAVADALLDVFQLASIRASAPLRVVAFFLDALASFALELKRALLLIELLLQLLRFGLREVLPVSVRTVKPCTILAPLRDVATRQRVLDTALAARQRFKDGRKL
jgi:hypothetical protein